MKIAITTIYILNCLFLMMVVLLQAGRGGGLSIGGGGGSATVFGNRGASTFLQKLTVWSAAMFMVLSMVLAHLSSRRSAVEEGIFLDPEDVPAVSAGGEGAGGTTAPAPVEAAPTEPAPTPGEGAPTEPVPAPTPAEGTPGSEG